LSLFPNPASLRHMLSMALEDNAADVTLEYLIKGTQACVMLAFPKYVDKSTLSLNLALRPLVFSHEPIAKLTHHNLQRGRQAT
jgi:hypothetical protein